eukprot:COSAG02_NODE_1859_length_10614_cov_53.814075_5_plen_173_part_00
MLNPRLALCAAQAVFTAALPREEAASDGYAAAAVLTGLVSVFFGAVHRSVATGGCGVRGRSPLDRLDLCVLSRAVRPDRSRTQRGITGEHSEAEGCTAALCVVFRVQFGRNDRRSLAERLVFFVQAIRPVVSASSGHGVRDSMGERQENHPCCREWLGDCIDGSDLTLYTEG